MRLYISDRVHVCVCVRWSFVFFCFVLSVYFQSNGTNRFGREKKQSRNVRSDSLTSNNGERMGWKKEKGVDSLSVILRPLRIEIDTFSYFVLIYDEKNLSTVSYSENEKHTTAAGKKRRGNNQIIVVLFEERYFGGDRGSR